MDSTPGNGPHRADPGPDGQIPLSAATCAPARTEAGTAPSEAAAGRRRILRLALPAMGEMVLHMAVWMIDTAMVGRLGAAALSSVGLGGQVYFSALFAVGAVGVGCTALVARHVGEGRLDRAGFYGGQSITLSLALGVLLTSAAWLAAPGVFRLAGLGREVSASGVVYLRILSLAAPFHLSNLAAGAILRGSGDARTPLFVAGLTNLINALADYLLIFGVGGFPRLGVRGAALASAAGVAAGSLAYVAVYLSGRPRVRPGRSSLFPLRPREAWRVLRLSIPAGLESLLMDGARTVNTFIITVLGTVPFAAAQVAIAAESLSFMPGYGFTLAASVLAGQNLGAGQHRRAVGETWQSLRMAVAVMGGMGLVFLLFPRPLTSLFTTDAGVVREAARCLFVAAFAQPFLAITEVLCGALRGAGDTRTPLGITVLGAWGLRVPLVFLAVRVAGLSLVYAWVVMVVEWAVRAVVSAALFRRGRWLRTRV
ncbi:MAG: MATE family efflux transporter [Acetobacteraceae bacterium]|nr:MATE family efflux transporter [Acetobacteraceae bacterium]